MSSQLLPVKTGPTAPLRNVRLFMELMAKLENRPRHLPGLGVFYGSSGVGKTHAGVFTANKSGAYYIECGASWNSSELVDNIYHELTGAAMKGTVAKKVRAIIDILSSDTRPLIIDEADHLVKKSMIDLVREIADKTSMPVLLIGEEHLPGKLRYFERSHNRVLDFQGAEPCDLSDTHQLAELYLKGLSIDEPLLQHVLEISDGVTRRICVNLERVREFAATAGLKSIGIRDWGDRVLHNGMPQPRRRKQTGRAA